MDYSYLIREHLADDQARDDLVRTTHPSLYACPSRKAVDDDVIEGSAADVSP